MEWFLIVMKKYADFNGRARRKEYWMFFLFYMIIAFGVGFIAGMIKVPLLSSVMMLVFIVPSIAVGVRRMHDVGKSGWFILIPIYSLILACTEGDKGPNEYGSDPKNGYDEMNKLGTDY